MNIEEQLKNIESKINEFEKKFVKYQPKTLLRYEVNLVEHCNLNCKGCYHFSPVAKETFLDVEEYERDCKRLSDLYDGQMSNIGLLGGEPLLHPQICEFMRITRENFPIGEIWILTNGILLDKMPDEFWKACQDYKVAIQCTRYPLTNVDYDGIGKKVKSLGLKYYYHNDVERDGEKKLIKYPFDLTGKYNPEYNYYHCFRANGCVTLKNGKLYTCVMAANFHILKEKFNLDVPLSERNGIDIYKATSAKEISEFLCKPIPFCRYCALDKKPEEYEWQTSKKDINEWL